MRYNTTYSILPFLAIVRGGEFRPLNQRVIMFTATF